MSITPAESALLPERLQPVFDELILSPTTQSSEGLLLDSIGRVLLLPEAVTIAQLEDNEERQKFIQLATDEWSVRVEAIERNPARVSQHVARQGMHIYAYHNGARFLVESTINAPAQEGDLISESWGVWGVKRPLASSFAYMWRQRFFFLLPDAIEMRGEDNFRAFSQGPDREKIRRGITSLLATAHPDVELTDASRDYWLRKGYAVVPPELSRATLEIEG